MRNKDFDLDDEEGFSDEELDAILKEYEELYES
jgi:hypothetical protein